MKKKQRQEKKRLRRYLRDSLKNAGSIETAFFMSRSYDNKYSIWLTSLEDANDMISELQRLVNEEESK
ncbi:hypothetical protein [Liquorilactobacillus satsumensis]|uniref:hypothetical protein n=1 Tax=Liquorilactobacillus TaxID=2767888 RepID=UPI0021C2E779|nr:hypothetical protein [Liquorilactobacillus satsumensis]MCP9313829.1 hypothetical protein [Liquorilactobacillus satsumensis]MCP9360970.1 hypothetical protein [Liquorilactobacillus satsumensis]